MGNKNLNRAKIDVNDEFYTKLVDIKNELKYYKRFLKDKVVYCNCDDYRTSNFVKYFLDNFEELELKKLIASNINIGDGAFLFEYDGKIENITDLEDGDFRSYELVEVFKSCDVIITNPPFSKYQQLVKLCFKHRKNFIMIGSKLSPTINYIWDRFIDERIRFGYTKPTGFIQPRKHRKKDLKGLTAWFTTFNIGKGHLKRIEYANVDLLQYDKFENYKAINVDSLKAIPDQRYNCYIAVPVTFLEYYNKKIHKIYNAGDVSYKYTKNRIIKDGVVNGRKVFTRVVFRHVIPE